ncbi:MAG: hotdog fold thioesterase [Alphaproteobacteria bacterium]|nr:hotdog fold thioesterase [Alphaproteobacteria bacterium]
MSAGPDAGPAEGSDERPRDLPHDRAAALLGVIARSPFAQLMGLQIKIAGDEILATLPFDEKLIGNHVIRALHGGAIASFLELTATARVHLAADQPRQPKIIDITVDYLRQGKAENLYATARIVKLGRRMASVHAEAWQQERAKPVSVLTAHFLIGG